MQTVEMPASAPAHTSASLSSWRVLLGGVVLALIVAALIMTLLLRPPLAELTDLVTTLSFTSVASLAVGFLIYRRGWVRSPSLSITLILTYIWAAVLTLVNVSIMAVRMFASRHDLELAVVLLVFASIIATSYGVFVAASVSDSLRQLAQTAKQVAAGNLAARAPVVGRDEVAQAAQAFNEMAARLQQASQQQAELEGMRRDLIAWVSHDLRTPLTSIRAMIEALNDGVVGDEATVQRYYRTMLHDVMQLNHLIDDLFELAQLDAGLELEMAPHSLSDLISDALESTRVVAQQKGIVLQGEVGDDLDPVVLNAAKIGRVIANLLGNAVQYTPAGGQVWVRAWRAEEGVQVAVADTGPGFAAADLPHIFDKFYRGEQARTRATGGAGLGLALAFRVIEMHGGRIWATNRPEGGAVVQFVLPG